MRPKIKICGVRDENTVRLSSALGVDYIGFNFVSFSRRKISVESAQKLKVLAPRVPFFVGVFSDDPEDFILDTAEKLALTHVQLHGDEPPEFCAKFKDRFQVIKAIKVSEAYPEKLVESYAGAVDFFLFEGPRAGVGQSFDWEKLKGLEPPRPYFLAGGLNAENVAEAIKKLEPYAVDTASGVEKNGEPDAERLESFIKNARSGSL